MIRPDDLSFMRAIVAATQAAGDSVLATIVSTRGSTPRKAGSRMLVRPDGGLIGTVGGGCGEGEVLEVAAAVARDGQARMVRVDLTEDLLSWSPAVCGGIMDILVERVPGVGIPRSTAEHSRPPARGVSRKAPVSDPAAEPVPADGSGPLPDPRQSAE